MKRCQLCDLIYEDDQIVCDMDRLELVYDTRELPLPESIEAQTEDPPSKPLSKNIAVLSLTVVLLGAMLFSIYYLYSRQTVPESANQSQAEVAMGQQPAPDPVSAMTDETASPDASQSPVTGVKSNKKASKTAKPTSAHGNSQARKQEEKRSKQEEKKPQSTNQKKETVFGSIFNKTKSILKKPF